MIVLVPHLEYFSTFLRVIPKQIQVTKNPFLICNLCNLSSHPNFWFRFIRPKLVITSFGSKSKYGESRWKTNLGKSSEAGVRWCNHSMCIGPFVEQVPVFCRSKTTEGLASQVCSMTSGKVHPEFAGKLLFYDSCHVGNEILRCKSLPIPIFKVWKFFRLVAWIFYWKSEDANKNHACFRKQPITVLACHETKIMVPRWNHPTWEVNKNQQRILLGIEHPPFLGHQLKPKDLPRVELWTIKYQPIGSTRSYVFLIRKKVWVDWWTC